MHYATLHNCISLQSRRRTLTLSESVTQLLRHRITVIHPETCVFLRFVPVCIDPSQTPLIIFARVFVRARTLPPTWGKKKLPSKCKTRKMTSGSTSCHDEQVFNHVFVCFFPRKLTVRQTLNEFNFGCGGLLKTKL